MLKRIIIIVLLAAVLALANNLLNPNGIEWVGYWPNVTDADTVWYSPSYEKGDPPTLLLQQALDRYIDGSYVFLDAREPIEYKEGHIKGAINLSYDFFDEQWDSVKTMLPKDTSIVTYCSGSECEASLYLARLLTEDYGYTHVEIFFGGWRLWSKHKLPIVGSYGDEDEDQ